MEFIVPVTTVFNTAPGLSSIKQELFDNTDVLCLNETEVHNTTLDNTYA